MVGASDRSRPNFSAMAARNSGPSRACTKSRAAGPRRTDSGGNDPPLPIGGKSLTTAPSAAGGTKLPTTTCSNGSLATGVARSAAKSSSIIGSLSASNPEPEYHESRSGTPIPRGMLPCSGAPGQVRPGDDGGRQVLRAGESIATAAVRGLGGIDYVPRLQTEAGANRLAVSLRTGVALCDRRTSQCHDDACCNRHRFHG